MAIHRRHRQHMRPIVGTSTRIVSTRAMRIMRSPYGHRIVVDTRVLSESERPNRSVSTPIGYDDGPPSPSLLHCRRNRAELHPRCRAARNPAAAAQARDAQTGGRAEHASLIRHSRPIALTEAGRLLLDDAPAFTAGGAAAGGDARLVAGKKTPLRDRLRRREHLRPAFARPHPISTSSLSR